jgi:hypothetical protein
VDARSVGPGRYWFAVRITVAGDAKASPDDRVRFPEWFQFVAEDGRIYAYSSRAIYPDLPRLEQCPPQARYRLSGVATTRLPNAPAEPSRHNGHSQPFSGAAGRCRAGRERAASPSSLLP